MEYKPYRVDLGAYITPDITELNTRTWGFALRNASKIDDLENDHELIEILVPGYISSVSTPFVEELMENIIIKLNANKSSFLERFKLVSSSKYNFDLYLEDAFNQVSKKEFAQPVF